MIVDEIYKKRTELAQELGKLGKEENMELGKKFKKIICRPNTDEQTILKIFVTAIFCFQGLFPIDYVERFAIAINYSADATSISNAINSTRVAHPRPFGLALANLFVALRDLLDTTSPITDFKSKLNQSDFAEKLTRHCKDIEHIGPWTIGAIFKLAYLIGWLQGRAETPIPLGKNVEAGLLRLFGISGNHKQVLYTRFVNQLHRYLAQVSGVSAYDINTAFFLL